MGAMMQTLESIIASIAVTFFLNYLLGAGTNCSSNVPDTNNKTYCRCDKDK